MKQKYVPLEKRSKRKQKEFHDMQRRSWGELNPITRKTANQKVYNRKKSERWHEYEPSVGFFMVCATETLTYFSLFGNIYAKAHGVNVPQTP